MDGWITARFIHRCGSSGHLKKHPETNGKIGFEPEFERRLHGVTSSENRFGDVAAAAAGTVGTPKGATAVTRPQGGSLKV